MLLEHLVADLRYGLSRRDGDQQLPEILPILKARKPPSFGSRTEALEGAKHHVLFVGNPTFVAAQLLAGQAHELLGPGIEDAVLLSAGSRLETLRERVKQRYGQIDADVAQWLMSRPVAMQSNLHNVLFVPADGVLYVANASHNKPAAEQPYVRLDLNELLQALPGTNVVTNTVAAGGN